MLDNHTTDAQQIHCKKISKKELGTIKHFKGELESSSRAEVLEASSKICQKVRINSTRIKCL